MTGTAAIDELFYTSEIVLIEPVDDKTIGREQFQDRAVLDGLQWPDPGIELLFRQLGLKVANTVIPYCCFLLQGCPRSQRLFLSWFLCGDKTGQSIPDTRFPPQPQSRTTLRFRHENRVISDSAHKALFY